MKWSSELRCSIVTADIKYGDPSLNLKIVFKSTINKDFPLLQNLEF